jgi:hypothetical protein
MVATRPNMKGTFGRTTRKIGVCGKIGFGFLIIGLLIFLVLYFHNPTPDKARDLLVAALWGLGVSIVYCLIRKLLYK